MKKATSFLILVMCISVSMAQNDGKFRNLEITKSLSMNRTITGISSDSTDGSNSDYFLMPESAIKGFVRQHTTGLNGTGFVKAVGTTISYDNTTYQPSLSASLPLSLVSNNLSIHKASATDSGCVSTTTQSFAGDKTLVGNTTFSGTITANTLSNGATTDSIVTVNTSTNLLRKIAASSIIGTSGWTTSGNTGTSPTTNFIGTIDNKPVKFRTGNVERLTIDSLGNVGIGVSGAALVMPLRVRVGTDQNISFNSYNSASSINSYNDANNAFTTLNIRGVDVRFYANTVEAQRLYPGGNCLFNNGATFPPSFTYFQQGNLVLNTSTNTSLSSYGTNDVSFSLLNTATNTAGNYSSLLFGNKDAYQSIITSQNVTAAVTAGGRLIFTTRSVGGLLTEALRITEKQGLLMGTTTEDASAIANFTAIDKGFLIPRMTTTQRNAIATPATSLMIYNNTLGQFQSYDGSVWYSLSTVKTTGTAPTDGVVTLSSGTATVSTTAISAGSKILISYQTCTSCGTAYIGTITAGTSFVINSSNGSDASTVLWSILY